MAAGEKEIVITDNITLTEVLKSLDLYKTEGSASVTVK